MHAELPRFVAATGIGNGPKVSGTKAKPIPVRLDVLDLLAPARFEDVKDRTDQGGYYSVATVLASWAHDWQESLFGDQSINAPSVGGLVPWLRHRLDLACDSHPAIGDFAVEVTRLHTTLMRITERQESKTVDDSDSVAQKLDDVKTAMFTGDAGLTVPENGMGMRLDAMLSATEVALLVGVTTMTISNWRRANKLTPAQLDKSGHAQYRLGDVLAVAHKR